MHTGSGIIKYDPRRGTMTKRTNWWCVVELDRNCELVQYYRWWINKELLNPLNLPNGPLKPQSWAPHISVIRGERPRPGLEHLWRKYHNQQVTFQYSHVGDYMIGHNNIGEAPGKFFLVEVECPQLIDIRKEFGLKHDWKLHLTFGRTYE